MIEHVLQRIRRAQRPAWADTGEQLRRRTEEGQGGQGGAGGGGAGGGGAAGGGAGGGDGGQGGQGEGGAAGAGGEGGQGGAGEPQGGAGGGGQGSGGGGGANAQNAAQRLLAKRDEELAEANRRLEELENQGKSETEKERTARERAEKARDEAQAKATRLERRGIVADAADAAKLPRKIVADLAEGRLLEFEEFTADDAKELVATIKTEYGIAELGEGGQPQTFGQPAGGGQGAGQGGQGGAGGGGGGQGDQGATGDPKKDYKGGIGRGILGVARSRGVEPPADGDE